MRLRRLSTLFVIATFIGLLTWARPGATAETSDEDGTSWHTVADLGFGIVDEDLFVSVLLEQGLRWEDLEVILSAPLRFRVLDRGRADPGVLRSYDWDEPSDFMRIPRRISFARVWQETALSFAFGELSGVGIGHGALADMYFNSTDMDHYQAGILLKGEHRGTGGEVLIDNVIEPEIVVARAFTTPLALFIDKNWATRFELGVSMGADFSAPRTPPGPSKAVIPAGGGDLSIRLYDSEALAVLQYTEIMGMDGDIGIHAGLASTWDIDERARWRLALRGEYRFLGPDYHPAVFNPFYEFNRYAYGLDAGGGVRTFADHLSSNEDLPSSHGFMVDASLTWTEGMRFSVRYDREGGRRPHWVMARFDLFPWQRYNLGLFYAAQDLTGKGGIFSLDALIGIATRSRIYGPLSAFAEFTRRYRRMDDSIDYANEAALGAGLVLEY